MLPLFKKIVIALKGGNTELTTLTNEVISVLKGQKKFDAETMYLSLDSAKTLLADSWGAAIGIRGVTDELSMLIENKLRKEYKKNFSFYCTTAYTFYLFAQNPDSRFCTDNDCSKRKPRANQKDSSLCP